VSGAIVLFSNRVGVVVYHPLNNLALNNREEDIEKDYLVSRVFFAIEAVAFKEAEIVNLGLYYRRYYLIPH